MTELILDIIAEYPQEKHIAQEMNPASMHKHRCQESKRNRDHRRRIYVNKMGKFIRDTTQSGE